MKGPDRCCQCGAIKAKCSAISDHLILEMQPALTYKTARLDIVKMKVGKVGAPKAGGGAGPTYWGQAAAGTHPSEECALPPAGHGPHKQSERACKTRRSRSRTLIVP